MTCPHIGCYASVLVNSESGDLENVPTDKLQTKPSGHVLPYVGVACLGAILFGYHLAYVSQMNNLMYIILHQNFQNLNETCLQ